MNLNNALRPLTFADYVGQRSIIERLRIAVTAAKHRQEALPHVLLSGPPGLGKTTLANIVANEMGSHAHIAMGPGLEKPQDIHGMLTRVQPGDVVFIDEIHRLPAAVGECMYEAMEDDRVTVMIDCKTHTRPLTLPLPPFTLIGATTQPGLLEAPLRDRFGLSLAMDFYKPAELSIILTANAAKLRVKVDPASIDLLAARSRGTPRIANHLLRSARDYATAAHGNGHIEPDFVRASLELQGIDEAGLDEQDRRYLRIIHDVYGGGPAGEAAIAAAMGLKRDTISGVIEPFLVSRSYVVRTPRGRCLTDKGRLHIGQAAAVTS